MNANRLADYLDHMRQAATDACGFVEGMTQEEFRHDKRTQQAVIMSLIVIGEAATTIINTFPEFVTLQPEIQWHGMRGMRNRIAHGYFDINLDLIWETVQTALPRLLSGLSSIRTSSD